MYIPHIVKKMINLNMYVEVIMYMSTLGMKSCGILFVEAYIDAMQIQSLKQFEKDIWSCYQSF